MSGLLFTLNYTRRRQGDQAAFPAGRPRAGRYWRETKSGAPGEVRA